MQKFAARFRYERTTKRTFRFIEIVDEGETPVIGTLYVRKEAFGEVDVPATLPVLTVVVSAGAEVAR